MEKSFNHRFVGWTNNREREKKKLRIIDLSEIPWSPGAKKISFTYRYRSVKPSRSIGRATLPFHPISLQLTPPRPLSQPSKNRRYTHSPAWDPVCLPSGHVVEQGRGTERRQSIRRSETCTHGVHTTRLCPVFSYPLERFASLLCVRAYMCIHACMYRLVEAEGIVCPPCGAVAWLTAVERLRAHTHGATERPTRFSHYLRLMVENAEVRWLCATAKERRRRRKKKKILNYFPAIEFRYRMIR